MRAHSSTLVTRGTGLRTTSGFLHPALCLVTMCQPSPSAGNATDAGRNTATVGTRPSGKLRGFPKPPTCPVQAHLTSRHTEPLIQYLPRLGYVWDARLSEMGTGNAVAHTHGLRACAAGGTGASSLPREGTRLPEITQQVEGQSQALNPGLLTLSQVLIFGEELTETGRVGWPEFGGLSFFHIPETSLTSPLPHGSVLSSWGMPA